MASDVFPLALTCREFFAPDRWDPIDESRAVMAADPLKSEGGRLERKAVCARLRRRIATFGESTPIGKVLTGELKWMLVRRQRYDAKPGGLGKRGRK